MKKEAGRSKNYRTDKDNRQKKEYPKKEAGEKMISGNNRKNYGDDNHKKRDMNRKNSSGRNKSEDRKSVKESGRGKQRTGNVSREQNTPGNCIYAKKCGGCQYQGISYKKQLKKKQKYVEELLGGMVPVEPILGMDDPFHYRNM